MEVSRERVDRQVRGLCRRRDVLAVLTVVVVIMTVGFALLRLTPMWLGFRGSTGGETLGVVMAGQYLYSEVAVVGLAGLLFALIFTVWGAATQVEITSLRGVLALMKD